MDTVFYRYLYTKLEGKKNMATKVDELQREVYLVHAHFVYCRLSCINFQKSSYSNTANLKSNDEKKNLTNV